MSLESSPPAGQQAAGAPALSSEAEPIGLWAAVWLLARLRVLIFINNFRRAGRWSKAGMIFLWLLALSAGVAIFVGSWSLTRFLNDPFLAQIAGDLPRLIEGLPALALSAAFLGILLTSFGVLLQALYLAGDMDFLISRPLPMRAVFLTKLLQAILPNFALTSLFLLPFLFGLGLSYGYHFLFYPLVVVMMAAMALAAAGISSLLVMLVVRIFPPRRAAEILGFIGATLTLLCSQSGQLAQWSEVSEAQAQQALTSVQRLNSPWLPLAWAGRGLVDIGRGEWLSGSLYLVLTLGIAAGIFWLALLSAERLYYSGWAGMQVVGRKKRPSQAVRPAADRPWKNRLAALLPPELRAILVKDWLVLRRDLRNMSQLVTPIIIGGIYAFMLLRSGDGAFEGRGQAPEAFTSMMQNAEVYLNIGLALFVGWMLLGRLAGMGFSMEGKSYWLLKSAPISAGQLITAKFLAAYLPAAALSGGFLLILWAIQGSGIGSLLYAVLATALATAGNAGLNLAMGVMGANLAWEDPRQMQRGWSGCLGSLLTTLYLPIIMLLFFGPPLAMGFFRLSAALGQAIGLILGGAFSLVAAVAPLWFARRWVEKLGES